MNKAVSISLVVPVYRSGSTLATFYERASEALQKISSDWEMILVDDASPDETWSAALALREQDARVKVIRFAKNKGQQHATLCGLGYATKRYVVTIDDDLQCFPEDLHLFIEQLNAGKHVVIGKILSAEKKHSAWRNLASRINQKLISKIMGKPTTFALSSYRAMSLAVVRQLVKYQGSHPHIAAMIFNSVPVTMMTNVTIRHSDRADGDVSTYTFKKLLKTISFLIVNYSLLPLRYVSIWGFFVSISSILFAVFIMLRTLLTDHAVPGWASLAILISFLAGNILLALGIQGEYLGRLVENASSLSQFPIIEEHLD
ncbi:glycosyltransferase family 2 protein [Pseudomonas sp. C1C7]|uniref:glycosyltransferase family 2 protein n=1 Tax=Pseudomonas sp. C1C7 TaxID=2735272 RepID=UPI001586997D|nr:glycosyltransferase family 2 protein [Pseudomonas sp. C1C7]